MIGEFESQPLFDGQPIQTLVQPILHFRLEGRVDGLFRILVQASRSRVVLLPSHGFQRRAVGDADDPGGDLRGIAKILGALPNDHEGIVDDLFDIFVARRESRQESRETPVITEIQFLQCLAVSCGDGDEEIVVVLSSRNFGR